MVAGQAGADAFFMGKALALAERGRGRTSPNPMVGALVVDDEGVIVGRGAHEAAGEPHAEVHALRDAGGRARGATLYCTLEPCSHTGRTGPCAPLVVAAGIRRAVIAMADPNPLVAGGGLRCLRDAGLTVETGVRRAEAERQNAAFLTTMRLGRPYVIVKAALSLDGMIAARGGAPAKLTSAAADRWIHRQRAEVDALGVGADTILHDDPRLTARLVHRARPLTRVIFDTRLRTPPSARVLSTLDAGPVIIISTENSSPEHAARAQALRERGASIESVPRHDLDAAMKRLAQLGVTSIVLEGGAALHRSAIEAGVVDAVQVYVTPRMLGQDAVAWVAPDVVALGALHERRATLLDEDVLIEGHVHRTD